MTDLKLIALDDEDLAVVSAHLQDAVVKVGNMAYLPREKRFATILNRFDWAAEAKRAAETMAQRKPRIPRRHRSMRRRSALRFERVTAARVMGIDLKSKSTVLALLAISFIPGANSPAGTVLLTFSGGAQVSLDVECIEGEMRDLGPRWAARRRPEHGDGGAETSTPSDGEDKP